MMEFQPPADMLVWVDLETTGDKASDVVLEVGIVVTDAKLVELGRRSWLVTSPVAESGVTVPDLRKRSVPIVQEMHDVSGLWDALSAKRAEPGVAWVTPNEVGKLAGKWVRAARQFNFPGEKTKVAFAGSGVGHFDMPIIRRDLPGLWDSVSEYWPLDIGAVRRFLRFAGFDGWTQPGQPVAKKHRALDDALDHLNEMRLYRRFLVELREATLWLTEEQFRDDEGPQIARGVSRAPTRFVRRCSYKPTPVSEQRCVRPEDHRGAHRLDADDDLLYVSAESVDAPSCPDAGYCHHANICDTAPGYCWRVETGGPLSGVFPDDEWPTEVVDRQRRIGFMREARPDSLPDHWIVDPSKLPSGSVMLPRDAAEWLTDPEAAAMKRLYEQFPEAPERCSFGRGSGMAGDPREQCVFVAGHRGVHDFRPVEITRVAVAEWQTATERRCRIEVDPLGSNCDLPMLYKVAEAADDLIYRCPVHGILL